MLFHRHTALASKDYEQVIQSSTFEDDRASLAGRAPSGVWLKATSAVGSESTPDCPTLASSKLLPARITLTANKEKPPARTSSASHATHAPN